MSNTARKSYSQSYSPKPKRSRKKNLDAAANILAGALAQSGLQEKVEEYLFVMQWEQVVGKTIAQKTKPYKLFRGCLFVSVENSTWAQELSFRKTVILERLQRLEVKGLKGAGKDGSKIRDMRFVVGAGE